MNPVVISTIIASASFIITIFFAVYLNQRHVDKLMEQMNRTLDARFDAVTNRFDAVSQRFDSVDRRLTSIETRVERIEGVIFKRITPLR
jgi:tetrahydromethanopterin S-methyltransferase subunit G